MSYASQVGANVANATNMYTTQKTDKKSKVMGQTVGTPKLSEKGQKYYEELKKKYGDMDFILVSSDMKETAKAQAGSYGKPGRTVVLIGEDEVEKMATDENFRKKYEGIITNARAQISQLKDGLEKSGAKVNSFGIQVNDNGTATLFASLEKNSSAQKTRIEEGAQKKAAQRKADKKAADRKKSQEKLEDKRTEGKAEDTVTFTANSVEELLKKVNEFTFMQRSDNVQTEAEKQIGQSFDLGI